MNKSKINKCISCDEKINIDVDDYNYTEDNDLLCEGCFSDDLNNPIATIINKDGVKHYKSEYNFINDNGDFGLDTCFNGIAEYVESIKYHKTDGWRGYYEGITPKGYKRVKNQWFCGFDGYNMDSFMDNLNEILENDIDYISCFNFFVSVLRTTNVFSQCLEVYVKENQKEEFINAINNY